MSETVRVLSWNLERVPARRRAAIDLRLSTLAYDIAVLTETRVGVGHDRDVLAPSAPPPGRFDDDERKVAIWSRWGWAAAEAAPDGALPERWAAGVTDTPGGRLRVVGLCVPYRFHWVRYRPDGVAKRRLWEEHLRFFEVITAPLVPAATRQIVAGDLNQRVPPDPRLDPVQVVEARHRALAGHQVATADAVGTDARPLLCHVASAGLAVHDVEVVDRFDDDGTPLSDHHGAIVSLRP